MTQSISPAADDARMIRWELVLGLTVFTTTLWLTILQLAAWLGPWSRLAAQFPGQNHGLDAVTYYPVSMDANLCSYGNCLVADVSPTLLTLRVMFPLRPFHPPITLPRSALTEVTRGRWWFINWVSFRVAGIKVRLSGSVATAEFWDERSCSSV